MYMLAGNIVIEYNAVSTAKDGRIQFFSTHILRYTQQTLYFLLTPDVQHLVNMGHMSDSATFPTVTKNSSLSNC